MVATSHAIIGGAIAASFTNPYIGLPLAFISHPLLDLVPHWDFGINWRKKSRRRLFLEASGDFLFGLIATFILFSQKVDIVYLATAIFLSESWDLVEAPYWILGWKVAPFKWFYGIQSKMQNRAMLPWGILTQIGVILIALSLIS